MRGAGDAAQVFGGQLGQTAVGAGYALSAVKDLSKGTSGLISQYGLLRVSAAGALAALAAVTVEATAQNQGWSNLKQDGFKPLAAQMSIVNSLLHKLPNDLGAVGGAVDSVTNTLRENAGWSSTAAGALAGLDAQARRTAAALYALRNQPADVVAEGGSTANLYANGGEALAALYGASDVVDRVAKKVRTGGGGGGIGGALKDQAQKAKEAAQSLKEAKNSLRDAAQGIADSFKPILDATSDQAALKLFPDKNGGVIGHLRKQLADTVRLKKDLDALSKKGLSKSLLSGLVGGGLESLPAAEELLQGNNASVASGLSAQINAAGGNIASGEVARNAQKKTVVEINIKGGDDALKKWLRKSIKVDGAASYGLVSA